MKHELVASPGSDGRLELPADATVRLARGRFPICVRVERGTVLLTREGDVDDHVLEPGDTIVLPSGGLAVAWALTAAAIRVRAPAGCAPDGAAA